MLAKFRSMIVSAIKWVKKNATALIMGGVVGACGAMKAAETAYVLATPIIALGVGWCGWQFYRDGSVQSLVTMAMVPMISLPTIVGLGLAAHGGVWIVFGVLVSIAGASFANDVFGTHTGELDISIPA